MTRSPLDRNGPEGRALKLGLVGTFLAATAIAGSRQRPDAERLDPLTLALTGMAAHRIGRMIAFERVGEPIREEFTRTIPDETGVDETVVARGRGVRWAIGELLSCPLCVGTWAALGLSIGMLVLPGPTRFVVRVLGIAGLAELNYVAVERLEWSARAARRASGRIGPGSSSRTATE
jgi:hypothetical protein